MKKTAIGVMVVVMIMLVVGCEQQTVRGPEGRRMTVSVPAGVSMQRGQTAQVDVSITRVGFSGSVMVSIENLPRGVAAAQTVRNVETDRTVFILNADPQADLVENQRVRIIAEGPDGMQITQYFPLSVVR